MKAEAPSFPQFHRGKDGFPQTFNRFHKSIPRRRRRWRSMMQECLVPGPEAVAILLNQRRRHRRIPESRMLLHTRRPSLGDIPSRSFESRVKALTARIAKLWRRRRRCINNHRLRMRASGQRYGQQQSSKCNPFLHIVPSLVDLRRPAKLSGRRFLIETPVRRKCCTDG
jgi:hypothetical protein